ncbi:pirin family protein [Phaeodactylibacter luteus]|uniref:Pirin family protein n=1 Tax=Phaeodactylibacter luteus TaxID=1564516 RepID=A0A5C6RKZ1_9BACT|nr:pirin family protein [Phaeodactylibacter luteus]TXB62913.1 pirin family protein [Phaeodactylibacter luteus]
MANNKLIVDERQKDLGNFMVGRLLPFRKKRQVGPFTFIDHMGPARIGDGSYVDVDQHPHIGLSTLTYLFEGEIEHRDSIGSVQVIRPGDVGFMTSGRGVTHTERTPQDGRGKMSTLHGYQIWVALPKAQEEMEPRFDYYPSTDIPSWTQGPLQIKLVAGEAFGQSAPLKGYSPLFMVDIFTEEETTLDLSGHLKGEVAFVIVKGSITSQGQKVEAGQMLISKTDEECEVCLDANSQILLFGGEPLPEERFLMWNFVSHSKERLKQARAEWVDKQFPKVPGDETYIPFPDFIR